MEHLLNPSKYEESLVTTKIISNKINKALGRTDLVLRKIENKQYDGWMWGRKTELKQRTGSRPEYIKEIYEDPSTMYPDTTIQKVSTTHGSELYIIYDSTLRYCQIFTKNDITNKTRTRWDKTEIGWVQITHSIVENKDVDLVDLDNPEEVRRVFLKRKEELSK